MASERNRSSGRLRGVLKNSLISLLALVLFFGALELVLALAGVRPLLLTEDPLVGFAGNVPLFVEDRLADGTAVMRTAENKLSLFNRQRFPREKGPDRFRIFCLGGSTTYGRPFRHEASFAGWLHAFLEAAEPGRDWEVINAGGVSYASYRVANLMKELAGYQPDLFIIYTGQNEFLEERSYGGLAGLPPWLVDTDALLNGTRTYSGMKRLYRSLRPSSLERARDRYQVSGEVDEILTHTRGPTSYRRDDELKQGVLTHYRLNLERMVRLARDAGAEVVLVTPAVNLKDMSPFKSEHREGLGEQERAALGSLLDRAGQLLAAGSAEEALALCRQALAIDDRYADAWFLQGRALFAQDRFDEAAQAFWRAVDEDVAPLRMLSAMPGILADTAAAHDVPLVDYREILGHAYRAKYGHTVFGREVFLDHVHATADGYRLLGLALFEQLREEGVVSAGASLSGEQVAEVSRRVMAELNSRDYGDAFLQLAKVLDWAGKFEEARSLLLKNLELFGPDGRTFAQLGRTLARNDRAEDAVSYLELALTAGTDEAWIHGLLGDLYREQGRDQQAIEAYLEELRLDPGNHVAHAHLGLLNISRGEADAARRHLEEALRLEPGFPPAAANLVALLYDGGQHDEALARGEELLGRHPGEYRTRYVVGMILLERGEADAAARHFEEVLRAEPGFEPARAALDRIGRARRETVS